MGITDKIDKHLVNEKRKGMSKVSVEISLDAIVELPYKKDSYGKYVNEIDTVEAENRVQSLVKKIESIRIPSIKIDRAWSTGNMNEV